MHPPNSSAIRLQDAEVMVRGQRVAYQVAGSGDPVVLVHGLAGSTRWWRRNVSALAEAHTIHLVNLPGFGSFRRRGSGLALAEAADWLGAWIEATGIGPCHIVAHSMGGHMAIRLAARRPSLARRLVLVAPALVAGRRPLLAYPFALIAAGRAASPSFLPLLALDTLRAGPLTLLRATRNLFAEDVQDELRNIVAPTLLVWGERDALVPPSLGPLLRAELPDARLLQIAGAGHVPQYDRPDLFNAATLAFLAGQAVGTAPSPEHHGYECGERHPLG
jgi:pimeloyl-ACP methyl ester carboxylesterase